MLRSLIKESEEKKSERELVEVRKRPVLDYDEIFEDSDLDDQ